TTRRLRSGLCVVDKPAGMTSHDVVAKLRRIVGTRKVGHAGTLDPAATGVLIVGVEKATRLLGYISAGSKDYSATIRLGQSTTTDDADGDVVTTSNAAGLTHARILLAIAPLMGEIDQIPSAVSAVRIAGKRAYQRVRDGECVEIPARRVSVTRFDLTEVRFHGERVDIDIEVSCSAGTYIRALARDLGAVLGVGGHLTALRRTRVAGFPISQAHTLEELAAHDQPVTIDLSSAVAAHFRRRDLDAAQTAKLRHGVPLPGTGIVGAYGAFAPDGEVVALLSELATDPDLATYPDAATRDPVARPLVVFS
ncbi:MAG: tRNA pseudouridine(55) synthase TruB, partial [Mycobacteriales bacterium]